MSNKNALQGANVRTSCISLRTPATNKHKVNTQKSPPWACGKGCAEACAERFSALKYLIWYPVHLRDRRGAASLCYKNGADQPPFLGVHPVWFSCRSKSYGMYCEHRLSCSLYDIYAVSHYSVWKVVSNRWKTTQRSNAKIQPTFYTLSECSYGNMNLSVRNYETKNRPWKTNI